MPETSVDLGFLDPEAEPWLLTNKFFPSKVGGRPAFLELENLLRPEQLKCKKCTEPLIFLCQVYAPNDELDHTFHRTIYVFICRNSKCNVANSNQNIRAFRCQMPRENKFYSWHPPDESTYSDPIPSPVPLCRVCGCRGPSSCSKCKKVQYCHAVHQRIDWKQRHRKECKEGAEMDDSPSSILLPEFDLCLEAESVEFDPKSDDEEAEKKRLAEYEELLKSGKAGDLSDVPDSEMEKYGGDSIADKTFLKFKERIKNDQDQVIRYERGGNPLWITTNNQLDVKEVPKCRICKKQRTFEFQIMPQLLNSLKNEDLDWGTILVYTCKADCKFENGYVEEFVYKQDFEKEDEDETIKEESSGGIVFQD